MDRQKTLQLLEDLHDWISKGYLYDSPNMRNRVREMIAELKKEV